MLRALIETYEEMEVRRREARATPEGSGRSEAYLKFKTAEDRFLAAARRLVEVK